VRKATVVLLGVNVDHVATLRQARGVGYPDPIDAALEAEAAGADGVTVHLREDRRHIQDADLERLRARLRTKLNLEMAATTEMKAIALRLRPADVCIVPERRQELTTEGGLDVRAEARVLDRLIGDLRAAGIRVSLFIDPHPEIVAAAAAAGASHVELHTGAYSAAEGAAAERELARLRDAATAAHTAGLVVNGGHGLTYANVRPVARLPHLNELNIGHSIVARAVFVGIGTAVREMKDLLR
jgi:pyridoxine 5-phosphate synthase